MYGREEDEEEKKTEQNLTFTFGFLNIEKRLVELME